MVGTVISRKRLLLFDQTALGAPTWVVDVDVGNQRRFLADVPVKGGSNGSRFYAAVGQTVLLKSNALGRWDVIAPASESIANTNVCTYDMATRTLVSEATRGFLFARVPFPFWQGDVRFRHVNSAETITITTTTITRSSGAGSFVSDGFSIGDEIVMQGTNFNDTGQDLPNEFHGPLTDVTPSQLIMAAATLVAEGPIAKIPIGIRGLSRWSNLVTSQSFNLIQKTDAQGIPV